MKNCIYLFVFILGLSFTVQASAGVSLVTVSEPVEVQLTIYQPADLCLVREHRELSLERGVNRLRISWHGLLVDPTSLEITPWQNKIGDSVSVLDISFPPRSRDQAICLVKSASGGRTPLEISYLTSGISWQPVYTAILAEDESSLRLERMITITNRSGKNYEGANFSVLTGDTHLVDRLADLARGPDPYGRPQEKRLKAPSSKALAGSDSIAVKRSLMSLEEASAHAPPEITREGVSDFFLFTIEGTQSIQDGWSKSLRMFATDDAAAVNLYKYDEHIYGSRPVRFITFVNGAPEITKPSPLPPGGITVYRSTGLDCHLCYEGRSEIPYVPVGETVELNLGTVTEVLVEPTLLEAATDRYSFDRKGNISGWDEIHRWKVEIYNTRSVPVRVQIDRHASTSDWEIDYKAAVGAFEKVDKNTFRFKEMLGAGERKTIEYTLTTRQGTPAEQRRRN
ncbi:MAG: DUF4139 domain-containing protein [Desulfatiglandaceae bacterium]